MRIWIDADGCPVVKQTIRIAKKYGVPVTIVKNIAHHFDATEGVEVLTVDKSVDRADFVITNALERGDIVISQDYGLHAMILARGAHGLQVSGQRITRQNIDGHLLRRHENRERRRKEKRYTKHRKRTTEDDRHFVEALVSLVEELTRD
jgi:uncharacterized protein YaiI (UPF0178 family)